MGAITTASGPGTTVNVGAQSSPKRDVTIGAASNYPGFLVLPSEGTYGNGVTMMSAAYGDSNVAEGYIEQLEVPAIHPQSNTPYDKSTAFSAKDHAEAVQHIIGKTYWLKGSSLSITKGGKIIAAASGLVELQTAHTATPLPHHTWICAKTVSSATWVQGTYIGITSMFTA